MLGDLLGIEPQVCLVTIVFVARRAARSGSCNRADRNDTIGAVGKDLDSRFWRGPEQQAMPAVEGELIGARVGRDEAAKGGERIGATRAEAAARNRLEDVARCDVAFDLLDGTAERLVIDINRRLGHGKRRRHRKPNHRFATLDRPRQALGGEMMLAVRLDRIVRAGGQRQHSRHTVRLNHNQRLGKIEQQVGKHSLAPPGDGFDHVDMVEADHPQRGDRERLVAIERR